MEGEREGERDVDNKGASLRNKLYITCVHIRVKKLKNHKTLY